MAKKSNRSRAQVHKFDALSEAVFRLANDIEEPLREAIHLVHVLSLLDTKDDEHEAIAFVANRAETLLKSAKEPLLRIFSVCRAERNSPS
jgi:hypothetical protein